tara:strand:+ start:1853 stop:2089 length:237 start_codon:yes stop_codon:yes gene_type:complete
MVIGDESICTEDCECGSKQYFYYCNQGMIAVCFKCGRFESSDLPTNLVDIFLEDPTILMSLIKGDYFKALSDITDPDR